MLSLTGSCDLPVAPGLERELVLLSGSRPRGHLWSLAPFTLLWSGIASDGKNESQGQEEAVELADRHHRSGVISL